MELRVRFKKTGETKTEQGICLLLCLLLLGQLVTLCVMNLTLLPAFSDYDASTNFLRVVEMHRQRRIIPEDWADTTMMQLDGSVPPAALLMTLTGNVFTAYGLANILLLALLLWTAWRAMGAMGLSPLLRLLGCNLLLCPYMMGRTEANILNYYTCILGSAAYYLGIFILIFGAVRVWHEPECGGEGRRGKLAARVLLCLGALISGVSRGIYLSMTCLAPALLCAFFCRDGKRPARLKGISALLGCNLLGKAAASRLLDFYSRDSNITLTDGAGVAENIGAMLRGWFSLMSAMPERRDIEVISPEGIVWLAGAAIALSLLLCALTGSARAVGKLRQEEPDAFLLPGVLFAWNAAVLLMTSSSYGSVFEDRYLLVMFLPAVLCLLLTLRESGKSMMLCLVAALGLCAGIRDVRSDRVVFITAPDTAWMDEVISAAEECPSPVVFYISKGDAAVIRYLRPMDAEHVYRDIWNRNEPGVMVPEKWKDGGGEVSPGLDNPEWGESTRYARAEEWGGPVLLMTGEGELDCLPEPLREQFRPVKTLECGIFVFEAESNVLGEE